MDIKEYIRQNKQLYDILLYYVENNDENQFRLLIDQIKRQNLVQNRAKLREFIHLIIKISSNHYRTPMFVIKLKELLLYLSDKIKKNFTNFEIFDLFKINKLLLLFLIENQVMKLDDIIINQIFNVESITFLYFYYPEIKKHLNSDQNEKIESKMIQYDQDVFTNFEKKRQIGENDSYICDLIRNDSVEQFIVYVNRSNIPLSCKIKQSIFETNSFLLKNQPTLIEYSAFFGAIQIFQYLVLNGIELNHSIILYAIHSNNHDLIHLIQEYYTNTDQNYYEKCLKEAIKCHHNDVANYFQNNFLNEEIGNKYDANVINYSCHYYNYSFFPNDISHKFIFYYSCKYDYYTIVDFIIKNHKLNDYSKKVNISPLYLAAKGNNKDIINLLQLNCGIKNLYHLFEGCSKLTEITILRNIRSIGEKAFFGCVSLHHIKIPSTIIAIGKKAFEGCISLVNITIPCLVNTIGDRAFAECKSLKDVIIPSSIKTGENVFLNCPLVEIHWC